MLEQESDDCLLRGADLPQLTLLGVPIHDIIALLGGKRADSRRYQEICARVRSACTRRLQGDTQAVFYAAQGRISRTLVGSSDLQRGSCTALQSQRHLYRARVFKLPSCRLQPHVASPCGGASTAHMRAHISKNCCGLASCVPTESYNTCLPITCATTYTSTQWTVFTVWGALRSQPCPGSPDKAVFLFAARARPGR